MGSPIGVSKITRNYQVSIPPEIRKKLGLGVGDFLAFIEEEGKVHIIKVKV